MKRKTIKASPVRTVRDARKEKLAADARAECKLEAPKAAAPKVEPVKPEPPKATVHQLPPPKPEAKPSKPEVLGPLSGFVVSGVALKAALLCAGKGEDRSYMNGVRFVNRDGRLEAVSTDGKLLMVQKISSIPGPAWADKGVTIARELLDVAVKVAGKDGDLRIEWGENHPCALVHVGPYATFKADANTAPFADYVQIIAKSAAAFSGVEVGPMSSNGAISPENLKRIAAISSALEADGVVAHQDQSKGPSVYTFAGGNVAAVVYAAPVSVDAPMSPATVALLAPAMKLTVAAIKAHITRQEKALKAAGSETAKKEAERKLAHLKDRLELCTPKLEAPKGSQAA